MNKSGLYFSFITTALIVFSCAKNETEERHLKSTEYYPYQVGNLREYDMDSVDYRTGGVVKRYHMLIKETVTDTFTDLAGNHAVRIEQFISRDTGKSYTFYAINSATWNSTGFERVENNQRYLKIVIPITDKKKWDGNLFNNLGQQDYVYNGIEQAYSNKYLNFTDCIHVTEMNDTSKISADKKTAIYASNYGLVYKLDKSIRYPDNTNVVGYIVEWKLRQFWIK